MTIAHLIYVPLVLLAGVMLGYGIGRRAAARDRERLARRLSDAEAELARRRLAEAKQAR